METLFCVNQHRAVLTMSKSVPENNWPEYLRAGMAKQGFNQPKLKNETGLGQSTISSYLNGERVPRNYDDILLVAKAFIEDKEDEFAIKAEVDRALVAAGYRPKGVSLKIVPTETETVVYEPIISDLAVAAQSGILDEESLRRIRRAIRNEVEDAALRQGRMLAPEIAPSPIRDDPRQRQPEDKRTASEKAAGVKPVKPGSPFA